MPYKHHEAHTEYEHEEYPKMLTQVDTATGRVVPVYYPAGHEKGGWPVIWENAAEEVAYLQPAKKGKK